MSDTQPQTITIDVLSEKYALDDEKTPEDVQVRVACALSENEEHPQHWSSQFYETMKAGFVTAGRISASAGANLATTLVNCFVQPIADRMSGYDERGMPGITTALQEAAETMRRGGGVGYDFSELRPKGAHVVGTNSEASGPLSYMQMFDRMCETVESAGARRGAQMGVLRVDHPDIWSFVVAKGQKGEFSNFNLSVGVTDAFMAAVEDDRSFDLVHQAAPAPWNRGPSVWFDSERELWVYERIRARDLWDCIMEQTYDHAEPGVLFIDRMNADNKLWYCEELRGVNPCAEQPLPAYGCCCLGSIDLTRFVQAPFTDRAAFDYFGFEQMTKTAVRMLDNVLDATGWPLEAQRREAMAKRRVGLGVLGLGDALIMMGYRYDTQQARDVAGGIVRVQRDAAHWASVELARERGAFPAFDAEQYLASDYVQRLPAPLREAIAADGIRNSHLLSIAPTGTIALAFADNASNGIEPPFSWTYPRRKREGDGFSEYTVEDHAYRLYREQGGDVDNLPASFVTALEISALDHQRMVSAVAPYIDASVSKTVNIPADYSFEDFKDVYLEAFRTGAKGCATYRPNEVTGAILLSDSDEQAPAPTESDPDRRVRLQELPQPALASLRWRNRPEPENGNPARTYTVRHPHGKFAVSVGHLENGHVRPFEVWVTGAEAPRGAEAIAKSLSMDLRTQDFAWVKAKLDSLTRVHDQPFEMALPPDGQVVEVPSTVAAIGRLVRHRCDELGVDEMDSQTPVIDALMSRKEPKTGPDGTMCWGADVYNPATNDDFVVMLKELCMPDGQRRPYSVWLAGEYPAALDGLCKILSFDMRVLDPAWIGAKLRGLTDLPEAQGDFLAWVPGEARQSVQPSTVAYMAKLLIHRYAMLGILNGDGEPIEPLGHVEAPEPAAEGGLRAVGAVETVAARGRRCGECGSYAVHRTGGCSVCTDCGATGDCG